MRARSNLFWVVVDDEDEAARIRLAGRFDRSSVPLVEEAIAGARDRNVVLDLGELTAIDGAAWFAVMRCEQRVRHMGKGFRLVNAWGGIRKMFESTRTDYLLTEGVTT